MRKVKVILSLALTAAMLVAMTGIAAADAAADDEAVLIVAGRVTSNNVGVGGAEVIAYADQDHKNEIGRTLTGPRGFYVIRDEKSDLDVGDTVYATASKLDLGFAASSGVIHGMVDGTKFCKEVNIAIILLKFEIPEFTTVAIPVGMILGLFYFFSWKRKQ